MLLLADKLIKHSFVDENSLKQDTLPTHGAQADPGSYVQLSLSAHVHAVGPVTFYCDLSSLKFKPKFNVNYEIVESGTKGDL